MLRELTLIATVTYDARVQTAKSQVAFIFDPLVRVPVIVFVLIGGMGMTEVAYAYLAGGASAIVVALLMISRERIIWGKPTMMNSYSKWAFPMAAVAIAGAVLNQLPATTIGFFWPKSDVAYYSSSLFLLSHLSIIGGSVMTLLFPTFSKLSADGRIAEIVDATRTGERYLSLISLPIVITVIVFPSQIAVILFGEDFGNSGQVLPFLGISAYIGLITLTVSAQVLGMSRTDLYVKWIYLNLFLTIALLIILVPSEVVGFDALGLSYKGAAIAAMISSLASYVVARWFAFTLTNLKPNLSILKHIIAASLTAMVLHFVGEIHHIARWFDIAASLAVATVVFLAVLWTIKEFSLFDIRFFLRNVSPGRLAVYVKEELRTKGKR